jgi:hypothetical protein
VGTVTADENGKFSTVIQPAPDKTSESLELTAKAPGGASTQARATIDPNGPKLHNPGTCGGFGQSEDLPAIGVQKRLGERPVLGRVAPADLPSRNRQTTREG